MTALALRLSLWFQFKGISSLLETRTADGLKAAEMLAKMCGWNEPERVNVQSVEVKVDAALIEQLRIGYAEMRKPRQLADTLAANNEVNGP